MNSVSLQDEKKSILILSKLRIKIQSMGFQEKFRHKASDFSRENRQKLSFSVVFLSLLHRMVKSLDVGVQELLCYLETIPTSDCRKQSYSAARKKIKWEGYVALHRDFITDYYADNSELKTYKGLIMIGIDGSSLCLPNVASLVDYFGAWQNQGVCRPLARISRAVDVLNLKVIDAQIAGCMTGEMVLAKRHIPILADLLGHNTPKLFLFDRNYPSYYWFGYLESLGNNYVVRAKSEGIFAEFGKSNSLDITVEIDVNMLSKYIQNTYYKEEVALGQGNSFPKKFRIRLVKILREGGEYMILATNLLDNISHPYENFEFIYHCRWGSETDYDKLKNVIQVENFSSITPLGILQEFHSATLMQNIASLVIEDAQAQIDLQLQEEVHAIEGNTKTQIADNQGYKQLIAPKKLICFAVAFGLIRNEIWNIIFFDEPIEKVTDRLIEKIKKRTHLIRPNRSYVRKKMRSKSLFPTNKRKVL